VHTDEVADSLVRIGILHGVLYDSLKRANAPQLEPLRERIKALEKERAAALAAKDTVLAMRLARNIRVKVDTLRTEGGTLAADTLRHKFVTELVKQARIAVDDTQKTLAGARSLEALTHRVVHAKPEIDCQKTEVRWDTGRSLTIKVTPRQETELAGLAKEAERKYEVQVLPDWAFRPSVGLSLVSVPKARFQKYEAVKEGEGQFRINPEGRTDDRFNLALTLSLTPRWLDGRRTNDVAFWLPEFSIDPTNDVKLLALGGGLSWRMAKLGLGVAWRRHSVLAGNSANDIITSDKIPTRDTYGRGRFYLSISLMGLPPFLQQ
jgi:hypothetical protein